MTLDEAVVKYYDYGDKSVFEDIWNNVKYMVNWGMYYIPTRAITVEDLQQECWVELWKQMGKWDKKRGTFSTFALMVVYIRLTRIISRLLKKLSTQFEFSVDQDYFDTLASNESVMYEYSAELLIKYFTDPVLRDILETLIFNPDNYYCANQNTEKSTIHEIAQKHGMTAKDVLKLIKDHKKEVKNIVLGV